MSKVAQDLTQLIEGCLHRDACRSIIPCNKLSCVINEQAVQEAVKELMVDGQLRSNGYDPAQLARKITPSVLILSEAGREVMQSRREFAVLIHIGKADSILKFAEYNVNDTDLYKPALALPEVEAEDEQKLRTAYSEFPIPCQERKLW